jgi:serine/threonine protein kinase
MTTGKDLSRGLEGRLLGGKYRLRRILGRGGMGIVFEAEHVGLGRMVAVKLVKPGSAPSQVELDRFNLEARSAARVAGEGVVQVIDIDYDAELGPYHVLELIVGESLRERLRRGALSPAEAVRVMLEVLDTLDRVHAAGIVHRDIKPGNVLLRSSDGRVKLLDFGVASVRDPELVPHKLTVPGAMPGTPGYMAPEQMEAVSIDRRADLYSLAQVMYACLAGRPPYHNIPLSEVITRTLAGNIPDLRADRPGLPEALYQAYERASARRPELRPSTAGELAAQLRSVLPELDDATPSVPPTPVSGIAMPRPDASKIPTLESTPGYTPPAATPWASPAPLPEAWMSPPPAQSWRPPPTHPVEPIPATRGVAFGDVRPRPRKSRWWIAIPIVLALALVIAGRSSASATCTSDGWRSRVAARRPSSAARRRAPIATRRCASTPPSSTSRSACSTSALRSDTGACTRRSTACAPMSAPNTCGKPCSITGRPIVRARAARSRCKVARGCRDK